jgi:hypothetical protein
VATLAFLAGKGDGRTNTLGYEIHEALHHPLVRIDAGAGQDFATVLRTRPASDLLGPVAEFLVIGDGIVQRSENNSGKKLARTVALLVVVGGAVDEILYVASFLALLLFSLAVPERRGKLPIGVGLRGAHSAWLPCDWDMAGCPADL